MIVSELMAELSKQSVTVEEIRRSLIFIGRRFGRWFKAFEDMDGSQNHQEIPSVIFEAVAFMDPLKEFDKASLAYPRLEDFLDEVKRLFNEAGKRRPDYIWAFRLAAGRALELKSLPVR